MTTTTTTGKLNAIDILELDIPDIDKLRAVLREELIPARTLHLLAVEFARAALVREREAGREPDDRCWRALDVKLAWLDGRASDEELAAADAAAWAAANAAARDAADAAAWDAAWAAADAAANAAARDAAYAAAYAAADAAARAADAATDAAAWAAAWAAARAAAYAEQVGLIKRMLREEVK